MEPLSKREKFEKFWSVLEKDKGFNKLPKKEYTKRVFLIAMNMTLDIFFSLKRGRISLQIRLNLII